MVVTLVGCWLGYQLNWRRQRAEHIDQMHQQQRDVFTAAIGRVDAPRAPVTLRMIGELDGVYKIYVFDGNDAAIASRLFPEAKVVVKDAGLRGTRFVWD